MDIDQKMYSLAPYHSKTFCDGEIFFPICNDCNTGAVSLTKNDFIIRENKPAIWGNSATARAACSLRVEVGGSTAAVSDNCAHRI